MKKTYLALFLVAFVGLFSCTKDFSDINTNKLGVPFGGGSGSSSALQDASASLPAMMQYIYPSNGAPGVASWVYQIQQNFNSDIYSGYWMQAGGFGHGSTVESNYFLVQGWDDYLYSSWSSILNPMATIKSSEYTYPNAVNEATLGMAYATKVLISSRVADAEGTLPYTTTDGVYDSLGTIYNAFFSELDSALFYLSKNPTSTVGANDYFYTGNTSKWIPLVNSLRLELAMRIVKVAPDLAKAQAEKAMATGNLITDNSQNARYIAPQEGALSTLWYTWGIGNTLVGADVGSYMVGYSDPRLPLFIKPTNSTDNKPSRLPFGSYVTSRLGSVAVPGDETINPGMFSMPGTAIPGSGELCSNHPNSSVFFNAAETNFLLAEAKLRNWNMGSYNQSAEAYYTAGVQASMNQWGVNIGSYLSTTARPADYVDPTIPARDHAAVSTCSPKWSDASTDEGHLEQIITQKWIALWPVNSPVAWSEYRRTGYPKLFPGYFTAVAPTVTRGGLTVNNARKIMLPNNEYLTNSGNVFDAITKYLHGADAITTPVWWDVDKPNF